MPIRRALIINGLARLLHSGIQKFVADEGLESYSAVYFRSQGNGSGKILIRIARVAGAKFARIPRRGRLRYYGEHRLIAMGWDQQIERACFQHSSPIALVGGV